MNFLTDSERFTFSKEQHLTNSLLTTKQNTFNIPSQTGCPFFPIYLQAAIFRRRRHQEELLPSCDCKADNLGLKMLKGSMSER